MDFPPINDKRCDNKMCQYTSACNVIVLFLTLILISGFAQTDEANRPDEKATDIIHQVSKENQPTNLNQHSGMNLSRMIVDFKPDEAYHQDLQVFNQGKNNLYVNVDVVEVQNPGSEQEKRVATKDLKTLTLVATPKKLIIPGSSQKNVRLVNLVEAGKTDRIYRVSFSPAVGKLKAKTSGIKILIAYQALVIVRPNQPVADVVAERKGKRIIFRNTGNTNVILQNGMQCDPKDKSQCKQLETRRLYAGNVWEFTLPFSGPVTFELDDGMKVKTKTFNEDGI